MSADQVRHVRRYNSSTSMRVDIAALRQQTMAAASKTTGIAISQAYEPRGDGPLPGGEEFMLELFTDVMIDIETMSLHKHNALILSIGMVEFDPKPIAGPRFGSRTMILPVLAHQLALGREVTRSTQDFWMKQSDEARDHWLNRKQPTAHRIDLDVVCNRVREFCAGKDRVWANGTQFDLSNLEQLSVDIKAEPLWHYRAPRDMRTFIEETRATRLVPIAEAMDIPGTPHNPIYDCLSQSWRVWSHYCADR